MIQVDRTKLTKPHNSARLTFEVVKINARPDLDRFKPVSGKIIDPPTPTSPADLHSKLRSPPDSKDVILDVSQSSIQSQKKLDGAGSRSSIKKPPTSKTPKPRKRKPSLSSSSKPKKRHPSRSPTDESPDPDQDSDINDLRLSDFEEPETKLRDRENESRSKFAKLRRARKRTSKKRLLQKELLSKRIVPDSDIEVEDHHPRGSTSRTQVDKRLKPEDTDSDSDASTATSCSSGSDSSSETDKEELRRKDKEFIVDDMATSAQKLRVQRQIEHVMPSKFRISKKDNLAHFKTVCEYLVHHSILPQIDWRKRRYEFDESCKHLDDLFQTRAVTPLESSAWILAFRKELKTRPYIAELTHSKGGLGCSACNNRTKLSKKLIRLTGQEYSIFTLNPIEVEPRKRRISSSDSDLIEDDSGGSSSGKSLEEDVKHKVKLDSHVFRDDNKVDFICGEDCAKRAVEYHFFKHWKINLLKPIKSKVSKVLDEEDNKIIAKKYKYKDKIPNPDRLKLLKREIRRIFDLIDQDRSDLNSSLYIDNLYQKFINRLNPRH